MTTKILPNGLKHIKSTIKFNGIRITTDTVYFTLGGEPIATFLLSHPFFKGDTINLAGVTGKIKVRSEKI